MTTVKCFCGMALPYVCDGDQGALLEWLHYYLIPYIVICTVVTISNWWFSSKDMKLRVLIKEALVVFHWLTLCIILLCSLASGHRALFLVQKTTQIYIYIYIIYNIIHNISNNHIIYLLYITEYANFLSQELSESAYLILEVETTRARKHF